VAHIPPPGVAVRDEIYEIDPLKDPRWGEFVENHARASVFHSIAWLEALQRTYGYNPIVFTTSPPGARLENGLVFCRVESWLTGRRLVSLPFSDYCEPLVDVAEDFQVLFVALEEHLQREKWRYVEMRPYCSLPGDIGGFRSTKTYCLHQLDLTVDLDTLFQKFHKDSTQRKIRRAERESLTVEEGRSNVLLDTFYRLQLLTRRRHQLPPQPKCWFRNLIDCFGEALKIRVASKDMRPAAAILTLRFKDTLVYKYGCSDSLLANLGGTQLLFWRSIQEAKQSKLRLFDLGRSDEEDDGLIIFKDRWGAKRSTLTYLRYPASACRLPTGGWKLQVANRIFAHMPDAFLSAVGSLLYRHVG
jgi:CelD/BcsL family acetyltransferase involved in cellulose biosynthesis